MTLVANKNKPKRTSGARKGKQRAAHTPNRTIKRACAGTSTAHMTRPRGSPPLTVGRPLEAPSHSSLGTSRKPGKKVKR